MPGDTDLEVRGAPGAGDTLIVFRFEDQASAAHFLDVLRLAWPEARFQLRPRPEAAFAPSDDQPGRTDSALRR
jgi:hypothetical protein